MREALTLLFFAAVFGGMGWYFWRQFKSDQTRASELQAMAVAQGWSISNRDEGRQPVTVITGPRGVWVLRLAQGYGGREGAARVSVSGSTEIWFPNVVWPGEVAVFAQRMGGSVPDGDLRGLVQNRLVQAMMGDLLPQELVREAGRMRQFPPPEGVELWMMASADPGALDLAAVHRAVHEGGGRAAGPAMVMLGPEGLRYKLGAELESAREIARFIAQGEALAARVLR